MFKQSILGLALCGALSGAVQASTMGADEERYFNFSKSSNGPFTGVWFTPISVDSTNTVVLEFYSGLNLTGTLMGSFAGSPNAYDFGTGSGLADGEFSLLVRQVSGSPGVGDDSGNFAAYWVKDGNYAGVSGGTVATDDRPVVTPPTSSVPEPGSLLLVAMAGLALAAAQRHRS